MTPAAGARPPRYRVTYLHDAGGVGACAALELARSLTTMLDEPVACEENFAAASGSVRVETPEGDAIVLRPAANSNVVHAVFEFLGRLGAQIPVGRAPILPRIDAARLHVAAAPAAPFAFARRAFVSDIMTWQYEHPDRFALHLAHDRDFVPWMAARGINAFSYIRHARDSCLKIDELAQPLAERGIAAEYGGHVLELLMPRDRFAANPEYFPADTNGRRNSRGNLCVANPAALAIVRDGAIRHLQDNPECELLHVWGADVFDGAWCRCGACAGLSPQRQYMKVVNAIAAALGDAQSAPVAYLAYHDTIEPDPALDPLPNVAFEWAPRERCYSHAIDDPACATNPRYLESLKRYIELFDGRGHVFEYYADAILFGGLGCATPAIIARDLRAYRALGLPSVSCLTFGAFSVLAYPVNLEAFVRGTRSPDFDPEATIADVAAGLHPRCATPMERAYRALARASALLLDGGGDVMRPAVTPASSADRTREVRAAGEIMREAIEAAEAMIAPAGDRLSAAELAIWRYGCEVMNGLSKYIAAMAERGPDRTRRADRAIKLIADAIENVRGIDPEFKGTWGAYDIEWVRELWLAALRRRIDPDAA
jgi:Domain of unknown function (DUF4838)